jgi:hypothetical protein
VYALWELDLPTRMPSRLVEDQNDVLVLASSYFSCEVGEGQGEDFRADRGQDEPVNLSG